MNRQSINVNVTALLTILVMLPAGGTAEAQSDSVRVPTCQASGELVRVPELPEGSGIAASTRSAGRFLSHNDSGDPLLVVLDSKGTVLGRIRVQEAKVEDWEAIAVGPCAKGSCVYIGDIGDNNARRPDITIYRFPEPAAVSASVERPHVIRARYPDGAHDAEALMVTPQGDVLIVTKGDTGPVGLYRLPSDAQTGSVVTLEAVGARPGAGKTVRDRITDAGLSPRGDWVALRTTSDLLFYRTSDLMSGNWREVSRIPLAALGERQGEGITFGDDRSLFLVGEGGGKSQPGTFGRMTCTF
jgi:hypothetical protein